MKKIFGWLAVAVFLIAAATAFYLWRQNSAPVLQSLNPVETPPPPVAQAEAPAHYPVPDNESAQPLPELSESDPAVRDALFDFLGSEWVSKYFRLQEIVRNIVVTVDNLPRKTAAMRLFPVKPVGGAFITTMIEGGPVIAPDNAKRYEPYVRIAEMVDAKKLVDAYVHLYPLFQRAYQDLGYPNGYFNDRLIAVIDHLLASPEVYGPIALVQPHVQYRFADPELEAASAGNKIMLRLGVDNAKKVKTKLREIRRELTGQVLKK